MSLTRSNNRLAQGLGVGLGRTRGTLDRRAVTVFLWRKEERATMFDLTIEGGLFIDGTGAAGEYRDVGIAEGRIAEIAPAGKLGRGRRRIDAEGRAVTPGFVDVHTHYDAQVFWDPCLSPSSIHGVTTVIGGNCGFSIAPLSDHDDGYMLRMLAEVEAIPASALAAGASWTWRTFKDYLDAVEVARPALNFGVMAGHSALRRAALGDRHTEPDPGPDALATMRALLREALSAGALGFSSSWNPLHKDGEGEPVPSRFSRAEELIALAGEVAAYPGTQIEFIPTVGAFSDEHIETMIAMSLASGRSLNWNVLIPENPDVARLQLDVSDLAAARGATILALTYPGPTTVRASVRSMLFRAVPGWAEVLDLPTSDAVKAFRDPDVRHRLRRSAQQSGSTAALVAHLMVADTHSDATSSAAGRRLGELADDRGGDAFDVLFDLCVADELRTGFLPEPLANSAASWETRLASLRDPRVIVGASDAGAHVEMLATFDYSVVLLALARERGTLSLPEAVNKLTDIPARLYGLADRGRLVEGAWADVVVFDPDTVGPGAPGWRNDLPGGAGRIYNEPTGIDHVVVNGTEIVGPDGLTGDRPGKVLRSGTDTK
jgi:N-acyl-D-aspartate/D-glutamate deacylase